jgi:hypothetical protein
MLERSLKAAALFGPTPGVGEPCPLGPSTDNSGDTGLIWFSP